MSYDASLCLCELGQLTRPAVPTQDRRLGRAPTACPVCDGSGVVAARAQPTHNVHVPRQQLRCELLRQLPGHVVRWGHRFLRYEQGRGGGDGLGGAGGSVRVFLETRTGEELEEECALLVAADGIYSAVGGQLLAHAFGNPEAATARLAAVPGGGAGGADALARYECRALAMGLRPLGVIVVLGISQIQHALLEKRVFQTLDGQTRIYVMPFAPAGSPHFHATQKGGEVASTMWQLSFPYVSTTSGEGEAGGVACSIGMSAAELKAEALRRYIYIYIYR